MIFNEIVEKMLRIFSVKKGEHVRIAQNCHIRHTQIGDYTYISRNAWLSHTNIGKFCSIGPNLFCGWGIHPINGISTSPMFYSPNKQNGVSLSTVAKIQEQKPIHIGNDVFIGANVTILDGITIGDGAVIGAGAVVSKNIPPYAIAIGCPIKIDKYRFSDEQIQSLLECQWWNLSYEKLSMIENLFWDIDTFIKQMKRLD
jgi:acetyltransferase-like isoleucine patch superfamily enzyme